MGPALSRWVGPGLVALQDGTTVWVSMRGRLWKCAREQNREATSHESSGAELLTHDHLRQLLMDARSPQTLTEAVDVSAEWAQEENQNPSHRSEAHPTDEVETRNQSPTPMLLSPRNDGQHGFLPELMRMDQIVAAESNRPTYPPSGLNDPTNLTEHPGAITTGTAEYPKMTSLSLRRSVPGRRRTPSQTSTTTPLPLEDCSSRSIDLDTVSELTDDRGPADPKRPMISEFSSSFI